MNGPTRITRPAARLVLSALGAAVAALVLGACGSSTSSSSAPAATESTAPMTSMAPMPSTSGSPSMSGGGSMSSAATITIKNYAFMGTASVAPGSSVMVMNDDSVTHTVTSNDGSAFDVTVPAGGMATFTAPSKAGTYPYHCDYHAEMHGTLKVS